MAGEKRFDYTLELCDYALSQVRPELATLPARPSRVPELRYGEWDQLELPVWAGRVVSQLPPALADTVWAGVGREWAPLPLSDDELFALAGVLGNPPTRLDRRFTWTPYPALHARSVGCVTEIREALTRQNAEEWAVASADFATRLSAERLPVAEGIDVIRDWLWGAKRLLLAMGAAEFVPAPMGTHGRPTMSNSTRHPVPHPSARGDVIVADPAAMLDRAPRVSLVGKLIRAVLSAGGPKPQREIGELKREIYGKYADEKSEAFRQLKLNANKWLSANSDGSYEIVGAGRGWLVLEAKPVSPALTLNSVNAAQTGREKSA